jgi:hypothetical protein
MVIARYTRGKWFAIVISSFLVLLVALAIPTFVGTTLRP